ncbi:flavin-containing monooxygenase [Parendozoicomonas haliclonae]|uniref:Phenylacetone monooxygenase n=1 Tax=Parendozoicomonas haliclonae TaxID=1960125 RepID=A0A1X7AT36_9GAMM|nr:NAD(P)-binding domain-containing protein [Parendozoicomonas haliclonae]SMA50557.1 Phenylacetone monooxygenase [Parendozoicomonas haliclonae]
MKIEQGQKVAIIGAGVSGLISAKSLLEKGITVDIFEKGSGIGGVWRFENDNGQSTCYRSLHINTSKRMMELSDFKFRDEIAEYPPHWEILSEFERYTDHFNVRPHIQFNTAVEHCEKDAGGKWQVTLNHQGEQRTETYDYLVVANGHHWKPRTPELPGSFDGLEIHAHHYIDVSSPVDLRDKKVVVVGVGNSAMDIACELSRTGQGAKTVYLAQRSGVWIIPKVIGNFAQDKFVRHPMVKPSLFETLSRTLIPRNLRKNLKDLFQQTMIKLLAGDPARMGLKPPKDPMSSRHPTVSQEIYNRLIHGNIKAKGNIVEKLGNKVRFEDGSEEEVDAIIYATGYDVAFPFFDKNFIDAPDNSFPLWQRVFDPEIDNIAFIGLVQPICSLMPIAQLQSEFLADVLAGEANLPSSATMQKEMQDFDRMMKDDYTPSPSHTLQVDCPEYSFYMRKAWQQAKKRAA